MNGKMQVALLSALLLSSAASAAMAQSINVAPGQVFHGDRLNDFNRDRDRDQDRDFDRDRDFDHNRSGTGHYPGGLGWQNDFGRQHSYGWHNEWRHDGNSLAREQQFNARVAQLRNEIAYRRARRVISAERAAWLTERLNRIVAMETSMRADGRLSMYEFMTLDNRLNGVQMAARGGFYY